MEGEAEDVRMVPGHPMYRVTVSGDVMREGKTKPLSPCVLKRGGYLAVNLWAYNKGKTRPVHQIVAEAFHGPRPSRKHDAAHVDGNKWNNHRDNIRWATRAENEADKVRHGKSNHGERNGMSKLTESQVVAIRGRLATGEHPATIAADYGVTKSHIFNIKRGHRHGH